MFEQVCSRCLSSAQPASGLIKCIGRKREESATKTTGGRERVWAASAELARRLNRRMVALNHGIASPRAQALVEDSRLLQAVASETPAEAKRRLMKSRNARNMETTLRVRETTEYEISCAYTPREGSTRQFEDFRRSPVAGLSISFGCRCRARLRTCPNVRASARTQGADGAAVRARKFVPSLHSSCCSAAHALLTLPPLLILHRVSDNTVVSVVWHFACLPPVSIHPVKRREELVCTRVHAFAKNP